MNDCISNKAYFNSNIVTSLEAKKAYFVGKTTVYEVVRIINGCPLFIEDHLERLQNSASILGIELWFTTQEILLKIAEFISNEAISIGNLKLQFTIDKPKSFFLLYQSSHSYPTSEMYSNGVITKTLNIVRNNPNAKNIQSFHAIAQSFIKENDLYEAILVDTDGNITEGSKSNIFFIQGNTIVTALASDVLLGITRKYVIKASLLLGLQIEERKISLKDLQKFDAAFIAGTSPKILPIQKINANVYKTNNVLLLNLMAKLDELIQQYIEFHNNKNK